MNIMKTTCALTIALEQREWKEADEQIGIAAAAINRLTGYLQQALNSL